MRQVIAYWTYQMLSALCQFKQSSSGASVSWMCLSTCSSLIPFMLSGEAVFGCNPSRLGFHPLASFHQQIPLARRGATRQCSRANGCGSEDIKGDQDGCSRTRHWILWLFLPLVSMLQVSKLLKMPVLFMCIFQFRTIRILQRLCQIMMRSKITLVECSWFKKPSWIEKSLLCIYFCFSTAM